jgi:hypothetical protein
MDVSDYFVFMSQFNRKTANGTRYNVCQSSTGNQEINFTLGKSKSFVTFQLVKILLFFQLPSLEDFAGGKRAE